ncbi:hypothetical protein ABKV19_023375 [Rosa sericea]
MDLSRLGLPIASLSHTKPRWRSQNPQRLSALSSSPSKVTKLALLLLGLSESSCRPPQPTIADLDSMNKFLVSPRSS